MLARKLQEEADDAFARSLQSAEEAAAPVIAPQRQPQPQPKKRNRARGGGAGGNEAWGRGRRLGRGEEDEDNNNEVDDGDAFRDVIAPRPPPQRQAPKARGRGAGGQRGRAGGGRGGGGGFGQHFQDLVRQLGVHQAAALFGGNGDLGLMMGGFGVGAGAAAARAPAAHMPADERLRSLLTRELTAEDYDLLSSLEDKEKKGAGASEAEVSRLPVYCWGESRRKKPRKSSPAMPIKTTSADGKVVWDLVGDSEPQVDQQQQQQLKNDVEKDKDKDKEEEEKCIICMEPFAPSDQVMRLPCQHVFHEACARSWLKVKHSCPIDAISII